MKTPFVEREDDQKDTRRNEGDEEEKPEENSIHDLCHKSPFRHEDVLSLSFILSSDQITD